MDGEAPDAVLVHYPDAVPLEDLLLWSDWALARVGFRPTNVLPIAAVCRDELMQRTEEGIAAVWGAPFMAGALAGMLFLGRTGIAAALGHAPGEDGRHRFAVFCLPHIAVADSGEIGRTRRVGMYRDSSACGALLALQQEIAAGHVSLDIDDEDPEQSLLRRRLFPLVPNAVPTLKELTEVARAAGVHDVLRLVRSLPAEQPVDVAVLSGVVVHGPDERDYVASVEAFVDIEGLRRTLAH